MKYVGYFLVIIFAVLLLLPLVWMILGSFQNNLALMKVPPSLKIRDMNLDNYIRLLKYPIFRWAFNSVFIAVSGSVLGCIINLLAGYAFAKKKFRGKELIFTLFLITMIIPSQITLIPSFLIVKGLGLYNSHLAVILPCGMAAFSIFLFRQYIEKIPDEFFAMATIDGAGELQKFFRILIPLSAPVIVTVLIMNFIGIWGNFLWQMIVLSKEEIITLPMGVAKVLSDEFMLRKDGLPGYGVMMAMATYSFIPVLVVFIIGQKHYMKNIFSGGLKG